MIYNVLLTLNKLYCISLLKCQKKTVKMCLIMKKICNFNLKFKWLKNCIEQNFVR